MPELPEVETVRQVLKEQIIGLKINRINIFHTNIIDNDLDYFYKNILQKKIIDISRLGKFLIFNLEDGNIVSHLRMEGKYFYLPISKDLNKHIHVVFELSNGYMLCYEDTRKFGRMVYKSNDELYTTPPLSNVGFEANLKEYDINQIFRKISNKKVPIKTVLLDQTIIAGLGNIYVNEVLFDSKILPTRSANTLTFEEVQSIMDSSYKILNRAIENKGTTIRSYTSSLGVIGSNQNYLQVHTKSVCPCCNLKLTKEKINGRMSYFCVNCQK